MEHFSLNTPAAFVVGAVCWCMVNSLIEEYVWRWFVFAQCEQLFSKGLAIGASGLFFTIHHTVVLSQYMSWQGTVLASIGVWIGGATWSWIYLRYRNIWAAYVSHIFADLAVFGIGYVQLFGN